MLNIKINKSVKKKYYQKIGFTFETQTRYGYSLSWTSTNIPGLNIL